MPDDDAESILRQRNVRPRSETVSEDEHIREIKSVGLENLGQLIGAGGNTSLAVFGAKLGLDSSSQSVEWQPKPYTELLKKWKCRDGSTVRVLRHLLCDMQREDCVELLDHLRTRPVHLTIRVHCNGGSDYLHAVECIIPGRRPLSDHVRPHLSQYLQSLRFTLSDPIRVQMKSIGSRLWNSSAEEFEGQQIDIYIDKLDLNTMPQRNTAPAGGGATNQTQESFERNCTRNANSECIGFDFYFQIVREAPVIPARVDFAALNDQPDPDIIRPRADVLYSRDDVIRPRADVIHSSNDAGPLLTGADSNSLQFQNDEVNVYELTITEPIAGFHDMRRVPADSRRVAADDILAGYVAQNGYYLIRPSRSGNPPLSISVTYSGKIVHLGIIQNHGRFSLFTNGASSTTLDGLIHYYRLHDIDRHPGLRLTNPIHPRPS